MNSKTLILFIALALSSCKNKKEEALVAEHDAQKAAIADLEFQINRASKKITENYIKDPSEKIETLNTQLAEIEAKKETLRDEIAAAKAETKKAAEKLEEYKASYPVKSN